MIRQRRYGFSLLAALAVVVSVACGSDAGNLPGNLLQNPGFEDGKSAWASLTTDAWQPDFALSSSITHAGSDSAYLEMRTDASTPAVRIWGVGQEFTAKQFPEELHGFYRVGPWTPDTKKQYLQVVVIAWGAENVPDPAFPNHQLRYILAGIDQPPFAIRNAKYVFLTTGAPQLDQWVEFKRNLADDFKRLWGAVPRNFDKVRVLFEVRFDDKAAEERPLADVYFDDLYVGSSTPGAQTGP